MMSDLNLELIWLFIAAVSRLGVSVKPRKAQYAHIYAFEVSRNSHDSG